MYIELLKYEDLEEDEKLGVSNNGCGKEYATYIKITHNGETICLESDAMEREDAMFCRDLYWIVDMFKMCYELGKQDGLEKGGDK